ncbi:MAG: phage terminase small subunit P27 family [Clostridia bacterium]|nr:phage terminase small subunit P27 family [Clostridia bacterium]
MNTGRARKVLGEQNGNLTKEQQVKRQAEQDLIKTSKKYFRKPPKWLKNPIAIKEYRRLVKSLDQMDMLGDLDANNLACYCNAFAKYTEATERLETLESLTISSGKGESGNPLINIQIKYAKEMRDFARLCGLSIDSRLKFAAAKLNDIDKSIGDEFGDI